MWKIYEISIFDYSKKYQNNVFIMNFLIEIQTAASKLKLKIHCQCQYQLMKKTWLFNFILDFKIELEWKKESTKEVVGSTLFSIGIYWKVVGKSGNCTPKTRSYLFLFSPAQFREKCGKPNNRNNGDGILL